MKTRTAVLTATVFMVSVAIGFAAGGFLLQQGDQDRVLTDFEVNSSNNVVTATFHNSSVDLMMEDGNPARFYIDKDRDGSADIELDTVSDGSINRATQLIFLDGKSYMMEFEYRDSDGEEGDAWLRLTSIEER